MEASLIESAVRSLQTPTTPKVFEFVCQECGQSKTASDPDVNTCRPCAAAVTEARSAARRAERAGSWLTLCPPLYADTDPARLPHAAQVMQWQYGSTGLMLHGVTGRGKTRCAWLLLHRLYVEELRSIAAFDAMDFSHQCAAEFSSGDEGGMKWIHRLAHLDVLFLDDLAKCKLTERVESELFGLIEKRCANLKPIIATTNFVGERLSDKMTADRGAPLVRRLREFCHCIAF